MDTVVESIVLESAENEATEDDGQIVVIRPQVVEDVGHFLGNMFQRIYHLVERARDVDVAMATDLDGVIRRLEAVLQLLMDYVSPLSLSVQAVSAAEVAQSLAQQLGDACGGAVRIEGAVPADGRLLADAGRLARAFGLLRLQLRPQAEGNDAVYIQATARPPVLALAVILPRGCVLERSPESAIQWSVAEKLLEIQGGWLQQRSTGSGDMSWEIKLPLQC